MILLWTIIAVKGITFLPTEFVPLVSLEYGAGEVIALRFDLCDAALYQNCLFEADLNSPFDLWSPDNGIYIKYSIIGGTNNCNQIYCSNNVLSKTAQNCSFYLDPNNGPVLYMISQAGNTAEIPSTFNLRIDCSSQGNSTFSSYTGGCPLTYENTRKNIKLTEPGSVMTSQIHPVFYEFVACPSSSPLTDFTFVLTATNQFSAFSSYLCPNTTCDVFSSPQGFFDTSASGFNFVSQTSVPGGIFSAAIYGYGQYNSTNNFNLNIQIQDSS
jgi:ribosomal protein L31